MTVFCGLIFPIEDIRTIQINNFSEYCFHVRIHIGPTGANVLYNVRRRKDEKAELYSGGGFSSSNGIWNNGMRRKRNG